MSGLVLGAAAVFSVLGLATWRAPRLTCAIAWSLLATIFGASGLLLILPGPFSERALWLALAVPFLWAAALFWSYWEARPWRAAALLIAVTALGAAIVALAPPDMSKG